MDVADGVAAESTDGLSCLAPELILLILRHIPSLAHRGNLGCTNRMLAALLASEEAWSDAWQARFGACARDDPRTSLRALRKLDAVKWLALPSNNEEPRWRQHFAAVTTGRYIIVFGGESGSNEIVFGARDYTHAYDLTRGTWHAVAQDCPHPRVRRFNADAGGGRVIREGESRRSGSDGRAWACFFGGHRLNGPRDNETWLLGPLDSSLPPERWRWLEVQGDGRPQSPARPTTRFHHTLTVLPGGVDDADLLVVCGGHDFAQRPIWDMAVLTMDDVAFVWESDHDVPAPPVAVHQLGWTRQERPLQPCPRAHHAACAWQRDAGRMACFIVHGGTIGNMVDPYYAPKSDTWLMDPVTNEWTRLDVTGAGARDVRGAMEVVRDQLIFLSNGEDPLDLNGAEGLMTLDLRSPRHWVHARMGASLREGTMHPTLMPCAGGDVLLVFGGAYPRSGYDLDDFGDPEDGFLGLHETRVLRTSALSDERPADWPTTEAAIVATSGLPVQTASSEPAWDVMGDGDRVLADGEVVSAHGRASDRFLLHNLEKQPALNGLIGTAVEARRASGNDRVRLEVANRSRFIRARRSNLVPSYGPHPTLLLPGEDGMSAIALHCSTVHGDDSIELGGSYANSGGIRIRPDFGGKIRATRLSLLP